jgi:flagellar biosynthesis protein FlhG
MPIIIPIGSGKGGVGKTLTALHLAIGLAKQGKAVVLIDTDTGSSNLHTLLGISKNQPGLGSIIRKQEKHINDLLLATQIPGLFFIPGDGWITGTANPPYWVKKRLEKEIHQLVADFVILDLGPGTNLFTLDMFLLSHTGLVVTTPESPTLLNSYSFIKHTALRALQQLTSRKSPGGMFIEALHGRHIGAHGITLGQAVNELESLDRELAQACREELKNFKPQVILSMGTSPKDLDFGSTLLKVTQSHLGISCDFIGFIPWYGKMRSIINNRTDLYQMDPDSLTSQAYLRVTKRILSFENSITNRYLPPDPEVLARDAFSPQSF